jgi:D-beta-D-heptose 7-phosphate kinase/D-beta-D-heptose 1-phosphate adenosyltransferase
MTLKLGIISGYFNPLHVGHLDLIERSLEKVDVLYVIVNSDLQRELKGSKYFMNQSDRSRIVSSIKRVAGTFLSIDKDRTVCKTIEELYHFFQYQYRESKDNMEIYFINGGDRSNSEIPESDTCRRLGITILDGFGEKVQSSSWLLREV